MIGRKYLVKVPTNTRHLLERFGLFTIILLGESIVSLLAVMHPEEGDWSSIGFSLVSFAIIISMWWQYFDNMEKKVDKGKETAGQIIIYGHLFIYLSLSLIAATIRLAFLKDVSYPFLINMAFAAVFIYFLSTTAVFHKYRFEEHRLKIFHLGLFLSLLGGFLLIDKLFIVPNILVFVQLAIFFAIYAKVTT